MMFSKELKLIKSSKYFSQDLYLCSVFIFDKPQFDFYSKKTKLVTSFVIENDKARLINKNERVFQKESRDLEELKLNDIKIDLDKALEIAGKLVKEKYKEDIAKKIIILQQDKFPFWNISSITASLKILNIKINAFNGNIIEEKLESILSYKK